MCVLTLRSRGGLVDAAQASELEEKGVLRAGDPKRGWRLGMLEAACRSAGCVLGCSSVAARLIGVVGLVCMWWIHSVSGPHR